MLTHYCHREILTQAIPALCSEKLNASFVSVMGGVAVLDMHSFSLMTSLLDGAYTVVFVLSLVAFAKLAKKWTAQQDFDNCTIQVRAKLSRGRSHGTSDDDFLTPHAWVLGVFLPCALCVSLSLCLSLSLSLSLSISLYHHHVHPQPGLCSCRNRTSRRPSYLPERRRH